MAKLDVVPVPAWPRYILIHRDNGPISGDTAALEGEWRKYYRPDEPDAGN